MADGAAKQVGLHGLSLLLLFGETLTAAAVFRVGLHVFVGAGSAPLTDEAASVDELPETKEENRSIKPYHVLPPLVCLLVAAGLFAWPHFLPWMTDAAARFSNQPGYWHTLYTGQTVSVPATPLPEPGSAMGSGDERTAGLHGLIATLLALGLALTSVYRHRLAKALRLGPYLETGMQPLRALQSGHPGDYVVWLTTGASMFGLLVMFFLRR